MTGNVRGSTFRHGLSFLAILAFVTSFFGSRVFTTLFPSVVVVQQGIHFHHFWYGMGMVALAGWLGISVRRSEQLDRVLAIMYGLGAGFVSDEVGLLLTFGNYYSGLTYLFFIGVVSSSVVSLLLLRYWQQLERDVIRLERGERLRHIGIFIAGFSAIFFAFSLTIFGIPTAILGILVVLLGARYRRR